MTERTGKRSMKDGQPRNQENASDDNFLILVETSLTGMVLVDSDGVVLYANPAAGKLFGQDRDALVGSPFGFPVILAETVEIHIPRQGSIVCAWPRLSRRVQSPDLLGPPAASQ